jgi:hypothetical protein
MRSPIAFGSMRHDYRARAVGNHLIDLCTILC